MKYKSKPFVKRKNQPKTAPWVILCLVLDIFAIALIPLNLFIADLPEWITVVFSVLIGSSTGLLWAKTSRFKVGKVFLSLFNVLSVLITLFGAYCNPYWNNLLFRVNADYYSKDYDAALSGEQAKSDLDYAVKYLQKCHPALIDGLTPEIEEKYKQTAEELSRTDNITVNALSGKIQRIFALLGDGHTYAADNCKNRRYLKDIYAHDQAEEKLIAVNGRSIDELFAEKSDLYSFEAESYGMVRMMDDLDTLEGLDYLGISVNDGAVFTYETKEGEQKDFTYYEQDFLPYQEYFKYNKLKDSSEEKPFVRYEILKEHSLTVLTLDSCKFNDEYINCLKEMFTEVKAGGIENVCVDLRNNGGGSSLVANEFIKYLDVPSYKDIGMIWRLGFAELEFDGGVTENQRYEDLLFKGNVYILTSLYTFSSAMDFTQYIADNGLGTVIGEPCGNSPNSFGEITAFKCPYSGIAFQVSTKNWTRIDKENTDLLLEPDVECEADKAMGKLFEIVG